MRAAPEVPRRLTAQDGQASVELVGVLPLVVLVAAVLWQLALTGQTAWLCANAARAGARAEAVGRPAGAAVRSALPRSLERGIEVERTGGGAVRVRLRVPLLLRRWRSPVTIGASAALPQAGST
ncbi:MAG TPA: TadE/TadG family type IV pilus assembly protein [Thermoleophilaceae bacterium]|jgi:pilus assembly protein CpaE